MQWVGYPDGLGITMTQLKEWLVRTAAATALSLFYFLADGSYCGETFYRVAPTPVSLPWISSYCLQRKAGG